jgi:hypothetical protein
VSVSAQISPETNHVKAAQRNIIMPHSSDIRGSKYTSCAGVIFEHLSSIAGVAGILELAKDDGDTFPHSPKTTIHDS